MLHEIELELDSLPRAERRVGTWILEHPREAQTSTLAEIAGRCGSSEPTVIRFCRRFGLSGFRELAVRLTEALSRPVTYIHQDVQPGDLPTDAAMKVVDASIQALFRVRAQLPGMPVAEAAERMSVARQLVFAGLGASGHVANDACHKFFRLGLPSMALTDMPSLLQYSAIADPRDVFIVTSHSGQWPGLVRATAAARGRGTCVVAITGRKTELARHADLLFACELREDTSVYTPMSSRLSHLALLDALQVVLALTLGDAAVDNLRRTKDVLTSAAGTRVPARAVPANEPHDA